MGIFLIFFPDEDHRQQSTDNNKKKPINFNLFSPYFSLPQSLKRTNSAHFVFKVQSTISVCALLIFTALLLFTISTLPSTTAPSGRNDNQSRRKLDEIPYSALNYSSHALQGMGILYRRGTRAMNDIIVAHVVESLNLHEFKLFLRLLYRSSVTSRCDVLFVFQSKSAVFDQAIREENELFMKLLSQYRNFMQQNNGTSSFSSFEVSHFVKKGNKMKETVEPIWGRRVRSNSSELNDTESTRLSYGSIVGFDVEELDPENSLSGFLDHVSMNFRRWACYPMLLGRIRRKFKHVALVDIKEILLLDDPFDKARTATIESVFLVSQLAAGKHGRKNSEKQRMVNPAFITGGARGVRRLSNLMLVEIVRASMQKKRKNSVAESLLFNQLVGNRFVLKNLELVVSTESVPELSLLIGPSLKNPPSTSSGSKHRLVKRGNSNLDFNSLLMKHICSFPIDSTLYHEC